MTAGHGGAPAATNDEGTCTNEDQPTKTKTGGESTALGSKSTRPRPFGDGAEAVLASGLGSPLPVPYGKKKKPPSGYTGADGIRPSGPDLEEWKAHRGGYNIALRVASDVVLIDVDAYDEKDGAATLADFEAKHGPLAPTWRLTSRDDGVSGIRLYRLPEGVDEAELGDMGPGVEIIRAGHRYAMAGGSVHPNGGIYEYVAPDGTRSLTPPHKDELAELTAAHVGGLRCKGKAKAKAKAGTTVSTTELEAQLEAHPALVESLRRYLAKTGDLFLVDVEMHAGMGLRDRLPNGHSWGNSGPGGAGLVGDDLCRAHRLDATAAAIGAPEVYVERTHAAYAATPWPRYAVERGDRDALEAVRRGPALPKDWAGKVAAAQLSGGAPSRGRQVAPAERREGLAGLLAHMSHWHHVPDPTHVVVVLAAAITRLEDAEPCWVLLVAPSSSGKTEVVRIIDDVAGARLDEVTQAGLLGWTKGKAVKPSGVLTRIGERALVTFGDLSTLLASSDRGGRDQLFAMLRRAYDGHTSRNVSPPGKVAEGYPETLEWSGRLTIVGCVTKAIDRYSAHAQELGARWLYVRLPERDTAAKREAAALLRLEGLSTRRREARALACALLDDVGELPKVPDAVADVIEDAALVTAWGRAAVPRNGYGAREIEGVADPEDPYRIIRQLTTLARGVLALGLPDEAAAAIARRVALDSMPETRRAVLEVLTTGEVLTTAGVGKAARLDRKVARMTLEDLAAIGVVDNDRRDDEVEAVGSAVHWFLTGEDGEIIARIFAAHRRSGGWDETWVCPPAGVGRNVGNSHEAPSISSSTGGEVEVETNISSHPLPALADSPCPGCGGRLEATRKAAGLACLSCYGRGA